MTTTAKINSKGTKGTGITEQLASQLHDNLGKTVVAIVELRSESRGENLKGDETVNLAIQTLEVIPEDVGAAEHVRELAHVAHYNRKLAEDGPTLPTDDSGPEPKVADVLAAGQALKSHAYVQAEGEVDDLCCEVCGAELGDARHDEAVRAAADEATGPDDDQPYAVDQCGDTEEHPAHTWEKGDITYRCEGLDHDIHDPANPAQAGDKNLSSPFTVVT